MIEPARRLGLSVPVDGLSLAELVGLTRRAEKLGFTDAWSHEVNVMDAFTPLAAAATAGSLRLGTAIVPVYTRPAGLIAMHAVAMSDLAPGRFVLGLGSSTRTVVETWMGLPFGQPMTRTRQAAVEVRALLSGERVGSLRLPRTPSQPVPIYMAALGPGMLRAAGEVADGVVFFLTGPRIIPSLLAGIGREMDSVARIVALHGKPADVMPAARRHITAYALVPYYARSLARQGFAAEVAGIQDLWQRGDRAAAPGQVSDEMVRELMLVGDAGAIRDGLSAYRRAGLRTPVLAVSASDRNALDSVLDEVADA